MTLYSADIMEFAKPVEKNTHKKTKKEAPADVLDIKPEPSEPLKKEMSEKRKAALAKAQETRKRKREEAQLAKQQEVESKKQEEEKIAKEKSLAEEKKILIKEKRRQARLAKKVSVPETPEEPKTEEPKIEEPKIEEPKTEEPKIEDNEDKPQRRKRARKNPADPPAWFQKYVEGVKKEQSKHVDQKVPQKQVKVEAQAQAKKSWDNGLTRDRVKNEVDQHMNRMYSMIFSR